METTINKDNIKPTKETLIKLNCLGYVTTNFTWGETYTQQIVYVCKDERKCHALLPRSTTTHSNTVTHSNCEGNKTHGGTRSYKKSR